MTQIAAPRTPESWGLITNLGSHGREEAGGAVRSIASASSLCFSAQRSATSTVLFIKWLFARGVAMARRPLVST